MNKKTKKIILYAVLIFACLILLFPIYWLINTSIQTPDQLYKVPPNLFPVTNPIPLYIDYILNTQVLRWLANSTIASLSAALISTVAGIFAAFSISRFRYKGRIVFVFLLLVTQMLPIAFLIIPLYFIFGNLRLTDSRLGLILIYTAFSTPVTTWFLKGFIDGIPKDIEDAAKIDGCNNFNLMFRIIFPLILPGIIATGTWAFIISWNDFVIANTLITNDKLWTISVGLASHIGVFYTSWEELMTGGLLAALPTLILFLIFQRYITGGLTAGSVKR